LLSRIRWNQIQVCLEGKMQLLQQGKRDQYAHDDTHHNSPLHLIELQT